jgi:hypothetical protein
LVPATLAHKVRQDPQDHKVFKASKVSRGLQGRQDPKVCRDLLDRLVLQGRKVLQVLLARLVFKDQLGQQVHKVFKVLLVLQVHKVFKV